MSKNLKQDNKKNIKLLRTALAFKLGIDIKDVNSANFKKISSLLSFKYSEYLESNDLSLVHGLANIYRAEKKKREQLNSIEEKVESFKSVKPDIEFNNIIQKRLNIPIENVKSTFFRKISNNLGSIYNICKKAFDVERFIKCYNSEVNIHNQNKSFKKEYKNKYNHIKKEIKNLKHKELIDMCEEYDDKEIISGYIVSAEYNGKGYETYCKTKESGLDTLIRHIIKYESSNIYDLEFESMLDILLEQ